jgi:hypothetical protein
LRVRAKVRFERLSLTEEIIEICGRLVEPFRVEKKSPAPRCRVTMTRLGPWRMLCLFSFAAPRSRRGAAKACFLK